MDFENRIFEGLSDTQFQGLALEIAQFQWQKCELYRQYGEGIGLREITDFNSIPFLPIGFFKSHRVLSSSVDDQSVVFKSSGTENTKRSEHLVSNPKVYERSFRSTFQKQFGSLEQAVILALLPNYIEQGHSSLVYMVSDLIHQTQSPLSGFFLNEWQLIYEHYTEALALGKTVYVIGVSYALLDLAETGLQFPQAKMIETGGMKGRRQECTKVELHDRLKRGLGVETLYSEYGMTELLSQAYASSEDLIFSCPSWMRVSVRDIYDPFCVLEFGQRGGLNVIDLANFNSCSFIATEDSGRLVEGGFLLEGRINEAEVRGCNLMLDQ